MKKQFLNCLGASFCATTKSAIGAMAATASCALTATALTFSALTASAASPSGFSATTETTDDNTASLKATNTVYDFANGTGKTDVSSMDNGITVTAKTSVKFGTNYTGGRNYIRIAPSSDTFKANDKITITGKSTKGNAQLYLYAVSKGTATLMYTTSALGTSETTHSYTVTSDCDSIRIGRANGSTATLTGIDVTRTTSDKTLMSASFAEASGTYLTTATSADIPDLTVTADGKTLESSAYTVTYASDDTDVFTIDGNKIKPVAAGTATLTATVTPTGDKASTYEGCTATYQVTVKAPSELAITVSDVSMNTVDAEVKQPVIRVYGDDDELLTLDTDYTLTYSVKAGGETVIVTVKDGVFSVSGKAYEWTEGSDVITVTATPKNTTTYTTGTATFTYTVFKGKIKPSFLSAYSGKTIPIKTYNSKTNKNKKELIIPIIYDGEDISSYFDYTFSLKEKDSETTSEDTRATSTTTVKADSKIKNKAVIDPKVAGTYTFTASATPNTKDGYDDVYQAPDDLTFTIIVGDDYIRPNVSLYPTSTSMTVGQKVSGSALTVTTTTDGVEVPLDDDKYTATWLSFTPAIVKVNSVDGSLEGLSEGTGMVYVYLKGTEGSNIETMMAELKVYVDDPAMYRAKDKDTDGNAVVYGNQALMQNQNKDISVILGGWQFPKNVTPDSGITSDPLSEDKSWAESATNAKWTLGGFQMIVNGTSSTNARQENGSNAMPQSTKIYNATFVEKGSVRDAMFNVPCSGSYLVFNPATNGTVTVHVFQNGVFDASGSNTQYRPQRRVFVMDEAGNFVSSSATIENSNGKPTGGVYTLSKYSWDLKSGELTEETVKSHFKGMESFTMSEEAFQNNVYESNLSNDVAPNPSASDDVKGSHGWCVLADSPVTYTFKVKAGKSYYLYNYGSKIGFYGYSFDADKNVTVDEIEYKSEANAKNTVTATAEGHVAKVTVPRSFKADTWNTCVLPFSLNKEQVDAIFGTTYGYNTNGENRDANENGTQILYFDRVENGKVYFVRHAYNTIVAGKPFLIKPAKEVTSINTASVEDYPYVTIENTEPQAWCAGADYSWVSSYNNMTVKAGDGFINTNTGKFMNYTGTDATLYAFRGYLKKNEASAAKTLNVAVSSNVEEDGSTTFIDNLQMDSDGNIFAPINDGKVYTTDGQAVAGDSKSLNALPSGVYIVNGKKYVK